MPTDPFGFLGTTVDTRYRIDAIIGEGGFGVVYRGLHLSLEQPIAFKCLKVPMHFTAEAKQLVLSRFVDEGKHLAKLSQHPSIVRIFDIGVADCPKQDKQVPYLALEWLDGHDLEAELKRRAKDPLSEREALELMRPVVDAIAFAHSLRIAHRDIKPANLFLAQTPCGRMLKVFDFGIAKVMQDGETQTQRTAQSLSGFRPFSPKYGAPEQFHSGDFGPTGPWTDVYALGLLLVELVTGQSAYKGDAMASCFFAAIADERPTPRNLGFTVSDAFERLCAATLARSSQDRLADGGALLLALDAALAEITTAPRMRAERRQALPIAAKDQLEAPPPSSGNDSSLPDTAGIIPGEPPSTPGLSPPPSGPEADDDEYFVPTEVFDRSKVFALANQASTTLPIFAPDAPGEPAEPPAGGTQGAARDSEPTPAPFCQPKVQQSKPAGRWLALGSAAALTLGLVAAFYWLWLPQEAEPAAGAPPSAEPVTLAGGAAGAVKGDVSQRLEQEPDSSLDAATSATASSGLSDQASASPATPAASAAATTEPAAAASEQKRRLLARQQAGWATETELLILERICSSDGDVRCREAALAALRAKRKMTPAAASAKLTESKAVRPEIREHR